MRFNIFAKKSNVNFNKDEADKLTMRAALIQISFAVLANLTALSPGMGLAFPAITSELLLKHDRTKFTMDQVSWFSSVTSLMCPFGGPISSYLVNKIGRKGLLIVINLLSMLHWAITALSSRSDNHTLFIQLIVTRLIAGLTVGLITVPGLLYSTEISHVKLKSRLAVLSVPFFLSLGILLIYLIGYLTGDDFHLASFYALGITTFALIVCFFIPESPVYLINKNQIEKATKAMAILGHLDKNSEKIQHQITKHQQANQLSSSSGLNVFVELRKQEFYKPLLIMFSFFAIQQLSGIFTLFVLAARFPIESGVAMDAFLSAVLLGVVRVICTFILSFTMNLFGRRQITIVSSIGMFISMLGIVLCKVTSLNEMSWLPAVFLFVFCIFGTPGVLTLPFVMITEIYPHKSRSLGIGITVSFCYIMSFVKIKTFGFLFEYFGNVAMFSFYAFISACGIIFSIYFLPETRGKTAQDMENYFKK